MINSREEALNILIKIDFYGAYSNLALKDMDKSLSPVDRAFVTRLVYGCISRKITLDYIISKFSKTKIQKLSKNVHEILRIGIYQIFFMDKVPNSAAVNECVNLCNKYAKISKGFVNGVLRNVVRQMDAIEYPTDKIELMRVKYSFKKSQCAQWADKFGYDFACELMEKLNSEPPLVIRSNTLKLKRDELMEKLREQKIEARAVVDVDNAIVVHGINVGQSDLYKKGYFTVQDTSAMTACTVLNPKPGDTVIDLCAAPGGKSTYMAELMKNQGQILSFDIYPHKIDLIDENAARLGIDIINTGVLDSAVENSHLIGRADKILVDVPCSGTGIIRRKPEIKWQRDNLEELYETQGKILNNAIKYLKVGGELVYSTCTLNSLENENAVKKAIEENSSMELVDFRELLPNRFRKETVGFVTLYPNTDDTDGFFICKMRKVRSTDND